MKKEFAYPWRHRESGKLVRIIEQGNTTVYVDEDGDSNELETSHFNRLYEDAVMTNRERAAEKEGEQNPSKAAKPKR